jgi:hypothetical protein
MLKFIFVILAAPLISLAQTAQSPKTCAIQLLKNNTNNQTANFVLQCDANVIAAHDITPLDQRSAAEVKQLKADFVQVLKNLLNTTDSVNCTETESEIFWIAVCSKS